MVSESLEIRDGRLLIDGADTVELAEKYGTPLYVMSETGIRRNCRSYVESIEKNYGGHGLVIFASKAFCCKEMCRIVESEKMGLDVVSAGEIATAYAAGFPMEKVYFHGSNKSLSEIEYALDRGVGTFVVDNNRELLLLSETAERKGIKADVIFRIKPGIDAHTHSFIRTGQIDSKFGFALETGEAMESVKYALNLDNIVVKGVHCHIGSQILDVEPFREAAAVMIGFMDSVRKETGVVLETLDLGGGFGIKYKSSDKAVPYSEYMEAVAETVKKSCEEKSLPLPFIILEPGRSITGAEGITIYEAGAVKEIPGIRTYVSVDGGMTDNPRYMLYQSEYEMTLAERADEPKTEKVTVAGKCCESGDLLGEGVMIQPVKPGDLLVVFSTGAYNYSMASNYNRLPKPAVVMVRDGESRIIVKRESLEDLSAWDL